MNKSILSIILFGFASVGCSLDAFVKAKDPEAETELTRSYMRTLQGAMSLFNAARANLQYGIKNTAIDVSLLTDELTIRPTNHNDHIGIPSSFVNTDIRYEQTQVLTTGVRVQGLFFSAYMEAQTARVSATHARTLFRELNDPSLMYAISATYAIEGYAIMIMAENMCSGIALSDVPFEEEAVYGNALRTDEVLRIAVAKFDSALQVSHDSIRYIALARIGKGRALMGLGEYERAAEAVKEVRLGDKFELRYPESNEQGGGFWTWVPANANTSSKVKGVEIVNREGINGLVWYTDPNTVDPRIPVETIINNGVRNFPTVVRQQKFVKGGITLQLAKWAEAKLIESEYLLGINDVNWIAPLNEARRSIGLSDTISPSSIDEKVDLLFRERAYWFYGEAVRLADFRRLVRQYQRSPYMVYPTGAFLRSSQHAHYGDAFVFVPHIREFEFNHRYTGCFHENP